MTKNNYCRWKKTANNRRGIKFGDELQITISSTGSNPTCTTTVSAQSILTMLPRVTSDPDLCTEKVTRMRAGIFRKHASYSEQLNMGKSSTFRQMEKLLIQMSKIRKMSPRGHLAVVPDTVECRKVHLFIRIPANETDRVETLRCFRKKYNCARIYSWNLRVVNEFRRDGQCWVVVLYVANNNKK